MIAEHYADQVPQAEILDQDEETGLISVASRQIEPGSATENACQKVSDRLDDLRDRLNENQLAAAKNVVRDLERTTTKYADHPRRVHDDFETCSVNLQTLLEQNELAPDEVITNLLRDLENGVMDIRHDVPEIDELAQPRAKTRLMRLPEGQRAQLLAGAETAAQMADEQLAEELKEDAETVADAPSTDGELVPMPDGPERIAAYRLGGRLLRISRMVPDSEKLKKLFAGTVNAADKVDKLAKGGGWLLLGGMAIYYLLGF